MVALGREIHGRQTSRIVKCEYGREVVGKGVLDIDTSGGYYPKCCGGRGLQNNSALLADVRNISMSEKGAFPRPGVTG